MQTQYLHCVREAGALMNNIRIGFGYDVHTFAENRKLILGGVEIPYIKGLLGHSDADVLVHAVMDSILGALALGDIGMHFPDTDEHYKDADSLALLKETVLLMHQNGYSLGNLDVTVVAEKPKLLPYIREMRQNIADVFGCGIENVNIKATTEEKMGFTGREDGIKAYSSVLIYK